MDDHHVYGDPFYAPPTSVQRVAGPPQPPRVVATAATVPTVTVPAPTAVAPELPPEAVIGAVQPVEPRHIPKSRLYGMRLEDLQKHARELGLDDKGKRPVLIARIKNHTQPPDAAPVQF